MTAIRFGVQARPRDLPSWLALARHVEAGGFDALLVADHPGAGPGPWPALGAAAAVTTTLGLGTYVLQTGLRDPVQIATDAATLDLLAPGRVRLGLGAGHTFREWEALGAERPRGADRAGRLVEVVDAVTDLLAGRTVTLDGRHLHLLDARIEGVPTEGRVRLSVGGTHPRILAAAARRADVVALSGLGRTLPDGHQHEVRWTRDALRAQLDLVRRAAAETGRTPEVEALVQEVTVTDDRDAALAALREGFPGLGAGDLGETPFVLVGTLAQIEEQVRRHAAESGITRFVVREPHVPAVAPLVRRLAQAA